MPEKDILVNVKKVQYRTFFHLKREFPERFRLKYYKMTKEGGREWYHSEHYILTYIRRCFLDILKGTGSRDFLHLVFL
jgi:hypothetical protein